MKIKVGKKQEFELGRYLRSRYQTYISDNFVPNEIYTLSSDTDRTIMSAGWVSLLNKTMRTFDV